MRSEILSLAVVVATFVLATTISAAPPVDFKRTIHVHIINELQHNQQLAVQCNCTDTRRPTGYVKPGAEYEWSFKEHFLRKTQWLCYLSPDNNRHANIEAFVDMTPTDNYNVYWAVKEDGIYFRFPNPPDFLTYKWESGR